LVTTVVGVAGSRHSVPMSVERVIAKVGAAQYGLVELGQLAAMGVRRHHVESRVRRGSLERVRSGVFVIAGTPPSFEQSALAAVLAAGPHAVASHTTAALLWALPLVEHEMFEVSTARPHWARMRGVRAHRTVAFLSCEHTTHCRIPVTTVARTLVDLSGSFSVAQLGRMADRALRRGKLRLDDLRKCVARTPSRTRSSSDSNRSCATATTSGLRPGRQRSRDALRPRARRQRAPGARPAAPRHSRQPALSHRSRISRPHDRCRDRRLGSPWHP
jgi:hypothetical protein